MGQSVRTERRAGGGARAHAVVPRIEKVPLPAEGRRRVLVDRLWPCVDGGRTAVKRCEGDVLRVEVDLVCDGHDHVAGVLCYERPGASMWLERPLEPCGNDRFRAELLLDRLGTWQLAVEAWVDGLESWRAALRKKADAHDVSDVDLKVGAALLREAAERARAHDERDADALHDAADVLADGTLDPEERVTAALADGLASLAGRYPDRGHATRSPAVRVIVEPVHARFAAWYELFPRSTGEGRSHGTFATAERWLPYVAAMGFDVLYLPPIHPIGRTARKGRNNSPSAGRDDPGSPWAIGAPEGGHTAVAPALGTLEDFERFVRKASEHGLRVALDIAFQASPDHPWVKEHPEWFRRRPDGSIQYAENPPKKYEDVYPFDFECDDWRSLWIALRDVFLFWIDRGVTIFRVDNPHTKPLPFWEWCLASVRALHPEVTFLSEAFTRPKLKYALAKAGFSQGYTYFTWRHSPRELREYLEELTRTEVAEYFRPSLWPNTPDILPEDLQHGGRAAFLARLVLAATLSSHYGIYGPAFELMEHVARPGSGEYQDNEKYEIKDWNLAAPHSLAPVITVINSIRRSHPALSRNDSLRFHDTDNDRLLCYSKREGEDVVLCVVSMDYYHRQSGWVDLNLTELSIDGHETYQVHDLLGGGRYLWTGRRNYVEIEPWSMPAHIFAIRRRVRTEHDFDYFM
ncbi:MAG TPA: alpha-1,4-glucan--maltose-1-phosphate maltosyltransferase [Sandaracinaceae bacterium]